MELQQRLQLVKVPARAPLMRIMIMMVRMLTKMSDDVYGPVAQPGHQYGGALEHLTFNEVVASSKAVSESLVRPVIVAGNGGYLCKSLM